MGLIEQRDDSVTITSPLAPGFEVHPGHPRRAYAERSFEPPAAQFAPLAEALATARDVRFDDAADDLAHVVVRGGRIDHELAERFFHAYGVVDAVGAIAISHAATRDAQLADLRRSFGDALHFANVRMGFGEVEGTLVAVLAYAPRVTLAPFPRTFAGRADLIGELAPGLDHLVVTRWEQGRQPVRDEPRLSLGRFRATITCEHEGPIWISLDATDATGAAHLAQLPVTCGADTDAGYQLEPTSNFHGDATAEYQLTAILNRERASHDIAALETLPVVQRAAHAYAVARSRGEVVDHPPELAPGFARWTVFHAESLERAAEHVIDEPSERTALVDPKLNRIGIGIVPAAEGGYWVAAIFVQVPHPIDVREALRWITSLVVARDHRTQIDPELERLATWYAGALAIGWRRDTLEPIAYSWLVAENRGAQIATQNYADLTKLDAHALFAGKRLRSAGVGVAQSATNGALAGAVWVVVIYTGEPDETEQVYDPLPLPDSGHR